MTTDPLAREITRRESRQSYLVMRLLVDRDLVEDGYRAYAYFRWADDMVDKYCASAAERIDFIRGERQLVQLLYQGGQPAHLRREEKFLAELIQHDRGPNSRLRSYIENFIAVIEFDAERKGRPISGDELETYTARLATAVTDAIQYFIGNGYPYLEHPYRTSSARAAHIAHMLRDLRQDLAVGFVNVPTEDQESYRLQLSDLESPAFRDWVKSRVNLARLELQRGEEYIDSLPILRTQIAAHWYSSHFAHLLDRIERDDYRLRLDYSDSSATLEFLGMVGITLRVTLHHVVRLLTGWGRRGDARESRRTSKPGGSLVRSGLTGP